MKIAQLCWSCDYCEAEESPPATSWSEVRRLAFAAGWVTFREEGMFEKHFCPDDKWCADV